MGWLAKDLPTLIFMLLPGFVAAGIFYTLTAHPKSSEFERVIQALIFTAILKVVVSFVHTGLFLVGRVVGTLGLWTSETELTWSLLFVYWANKDIFSIHECENGD